MDIKVDGLNAAAFCPFNRSGCECWILRNQGCDAPDCPVPGKGDLPPNYCPLIKEPAQVFRDYKGYECDVCGNFISPDEAGDRSVCPVCHTPQAEWNGVLLVPAWKFAGKI